MDILMPVEKSNDITELSKHGATEYYCGYYPLSLATKFNNEAIVQNGRALVSINKRENLNCNVTNRESLKKMIEEANRTNTKLYLALNSFYYPGYVYDLLFEYIKDVILMGIHGLIISDPGLISMVRERFPKAKIILSCITQVENNQAVKFFSDMGINRITFPRHTTMDDIISITNSNPELEFECFIFGLGMKCIYDNGHCHSIHPGAFCCDQWEYWYYPNNRGEFTTCEWENMLRNEQYFERWTRPLPARGDKWGGWHRFECGICSLHSLLNYTNVKVLKVEGRGLGMEAKVNALKILKKAINMAQEGLGVLALQDYVKSVLPNPEHCDSRYRCYMPDIREGT